MVIRALFCLVSAGVRPDVVDKVWPVASVRALHHYLLEIKKITQSAGTCHRLRHHLTVLRTIFGKASLSVNIYVKVRLWTACKGDSDINASQMPVRWTKVWTVRGLWQMWWERFSVGVTPPHPLFDAAYRQRARVFLTEMIQRPA